MFSASLTILVLYIRRTKSFFYSVSISFSFLSLLLVEALLKFSFFYCLNIWRHSHFVPVQLCVAARSSLPLGPPKLSVAARSSLPLGPPKLSVAARSSLPLGPPKLSVAARSSLPLGPPKLRAVPPLATFYS